MKQSLQLKLGQQLTMTPQLQQAIRLLQLSTLDLQQEIQQALDTNPMLEMAEDDSDLDGDFSPGDDTGATSGETKSDGPMENLERAATELPDDNADWDIGLPEDLPVDTQWDDLLPAASASSFS
ncbi:MAG: RNA polymerase factor sigma-54, partial [Halieaceae bacterium]|nr:RNA polymerase factor sigma-54 [Halieaceae bacterium]